MEAKQRAPMSRPRSRGGTSAGPSAYQGVPTRSFPVISIVVTFVIVQMVGCIDVNRIMHVGFILFLPMVVPRSDVDVGGINPVVIFHFFHVFELLSFSK